MIGILVRERRVVIISRPDAAGQIRRETDKPAVPVIRRRPGLSGGRHLPQVNLSVCCPFRIRDDTPHRRSQKRSRAVLDHRPRLRVGIVKHDIAICVKHLRIKVRLQILSVIGDGRVCPRQLQICDTVCQSAQRERLTDIRVCPAVRRL